MLLREFYDTARNHYQDVADDNSQPRLGDLRKTKLTLAMINKLRRFSDVRAMEQKERLEQVRKQYAPPAAAPGM